MSITQQHLLDTYRARTLGEPAPPAPGTHGRPAVREPSDTQRSRAGRHGLRDVLSRWRRLTT
ncbi:hypothetical protein OR263_31855 [Streptomyces sp. NEAU-H22]|uniref:hypothetical protein n=1 Tax=unclassified Streptomyces TaxID=2593676 RepID=UPI0022584CE7|nr:MULTISPECIES: hypothetical protein [unclassified Streptomyces]MCX3291251.1 hypothetical protein [Streptomyces sp. NEAU-H22]WMD03275.1 hypothetical protein Q7C01_02265 [Streptomyces sp. FXY-T5]